VDADVFEGGIDGKKTNGCRLWVSTRTTANGYREKRDGLVSEVEVLEKAVENAFAAQKLVFQA